MKQPEFISVADYLAGEEISDVKHEYIGGAVHAMAVCQPNPSSDHFQDQPGVIIEVLSDSTRRADLYEKRDAYLTIHSLKVLVFVESDAASVTLHRAQAGGGLGIEQHKDPATGNQCLPAAGRGL